MGASLGEYDGLPVLSQEIKLAGLGTGLSRNLAVDPVEIHPKQKYYLVLEVAASETGFKPSDEDEGYVRIDKLKASAAAFIPADSVREALAEQARRVEEAKGIMQLPLDQIPEPSDEAPAEGDATVASIKQRRTRKPRAKAEAAPETDADAEF